MLSGLKFIPRDEVDKEKDETRDDSRKGRGKSSSRKEKHGRKKKNSQNSSSDDEGLERIKSGSRNKKWYDSDEDCSSSSGKSDSQSESEEERRKHKRRKGKKKGYDDGSKNKHKRESKKKRRKHDSPSDESLNSSESEKSIDQQRHHRGGKSESNKGDKRADDGGESESPSYNNIVRKEMGLEWMLRPKEGMEKTSHQVSDVQSQEVQDEQMERDNPRELNPYLKNNGIGYPEESDEKKSGSRELLSTKVVGDGGASWRLKALKRAQEQATREGRKLQEVVEERWGSMSQFAASVASHNVAPTHAHLQAIKGRRKYLTAEDERNVDGETDRSVKDTDRKNIKDITPRHPKMAVPKVHDSLSWGKRVKKNLSTEDAALVSAAISGLNKFSNDGSFLEKFVNQKKDNYGEPSNTSREKSEGTAEPSSGGVAPEETKEEAGTARPGLSANQLAAKALQLRMKGKHEEAEQLLKEAEKVKTMQDTGNETSRPRIDGTTSRFIMRDVSSRQMKKEEDADIHLAQKIMHNHRFSVAGQADEEYDYDGSPRRKAKKKAGASSYKSDITNSAKRILTQEERCLFCFENPNRPKHLVIAIANFTYLSLPQRQPVVPGHCGILTLQHESSTRTVDDNVWDEIRNFKKCLIMMFAKQEKDVVFLETVMGLQQQRRHCMVECVPVPKEIAKQAPVYFKKAIDEAEDEWSQHNAKKLIDTSQKGLRGSIPKNFPYFHVEFGLNRGFVHVIDDEKGFKSSFGLDVIRGMLKLPAEEMHRRSRHEPIEAQKQAAANFSRDWGPFDWTKQLD